MNTYDVHFNLKQNGLTIGRDKVTVFAPTAGDAVVRAAAVLESGGHAFDVAITSVTMAVGVTVDVSDVVMAASLQSVRVQIGELRLALCRIRDLTGGEAAPATTAEALAETLMAVHTVAVLALR